MLSAALLCASLAWAGPSAAQAPRLSPALALPADPDAFDENDAFRRRLLEPGVSDWYALATTPPMLVVVEKGYLDPAALARLGSELAEAAARIPAVLGRSRIGPGRVTVYVYGSGPMSQAGVPGAFSGEKGLMLRFVEEDRAPLFHELTHMFAGDTTSQSLCEGVAQWVQEALRPGKANAFTPSRADPDALAAAAVARYPRPFFEAVGAPGWNSWSGQDVRQAFYFASWSFTSFLIRRGGLPAFLQVMDAGASDEAYLRAFGRPLAALRSEWARGLPPARP